MVLFNPEVVWSSDERSTYEEGCLSIPEQYAEVERPSEVRVRWMAEDGSVPSVEISTRAVRSPTVQVWDCSSKDASTAPLT